jgi:uncharacterized protein with GYD domain
MNYTDEGIKTIRESPRRIEETIIKTWESMGGKMISVYSIMGDYDLIAIGELPSDDLAATFALKLSNNKNVRTTTLKAFTIKSSDFKDNTMSTYVILMKYTDEGIKRVMGAPKRIQEGIEAMEAKGGKLIGFYSVMGRYDFVAIGKAPDDESTSHFILKLGSLGNVRTVTFRAFTMEEFAEIVKKLP